MGFPIFFTGPYAECPVAEGGPDWPEWLAQLEEEETLSGVSPDGVITSAVVDGRWCKLHRFIPLARRPGHPPRGSLQWTRVSMHDAEDLSGVSPAAEMQWLQEAFAPELGRLAEHYGRPVRLRWGTLYLMD
jgi:hypothetical protein